MEARDATAAADRRFAGFIPALCDRSLAPSVFEPCAVDLAERVVARHPARAIPPDAEIVATDLDQPMLYRAVALDMTRPAAWR